MNIYLRFRYGRKNITSLGLFLYGISSILVGLTCTKARLILSLLFFGFTGGIALTPSLPEFGDFAEERGGKMYAQAYALYNMAYCIGMITGPILGGYLYESYGILARLTLGFKYQMIAFGVVSLSTAPIVLYFWWIRRPRDIVAQHEIGSEIAIL